MSNFLPARLRTMRKIFEQEKLKRQQEAEIARANIDNPYQRACNQMVDFYRKYEDRFTEYFSEPREPSERKEFIKEIYGLLNYTAPTALPQHHQSDMTLYRGLSADDTQDIYQYTNDFSTGDVVFGKKAQLHGIGIYMTTNENVALKYATYGGPCGSILRCEPIENIKLANSEQLMADKEEVLKLMISQNQDDRGVLMYSNFLSDNGVFASIAGYDAINIPEKDYVLILNRGSIAVDDISYYKDGQQYTAEEFEEQFLQEEIEFTHTK